MAIRRHTTMNLDEELVRAAQEVLGTNQRTETVHAALAEVVNRARRRHAIDYAFIDLSPDVLEREREGGEARSEKG